MLTQKWSESPLAFLLGWNKDKENARQTSESQSGQRTRSSKSICLLFQAANYEHTHTHTHTGTHTHQDGAGRPDSPEEQGLGLWWCARAAPHAQLPALGAAPACLLPALPPSGAKVPESGKGVHTYKGWNQFGPNPQSSPSASWDLPGPVGWGQPLHTGEAFAHTGL